MKFTMAEEEITAATADMNPPLMAFIPNPTGKNSGDKTKITGLNPRSRKHFVSGKFYRK